MRKNSSFFYTFYAWINDLFLQSKNQFLKIPEKYESVKFTCIVRYLVEKFSSITLFPLRDTRS